MAYKIEHDRPNCIGCGACAAVCPKHWVMGEDGKSDIVASVMRQDGWEELEVADGEFDCNMEAAKSCPVNVIHLSKKETGEKLI